MKKSKIILFTFLVIALIIYSCQNDDLPEANFNLDGVAVFSGEVAHEKANLVWQSPTGDLSPVNYILNWSPDGVKTILDASVNSYEVKGLTNGVIYEFSLQADYGSTGISGVNEIELTPRDELNFRALPGNELAIVLWDTPNRTDIVGYTLTQELNNTKVEISADKNSFQITDLENDTEYTFSFVINYTSGEVSKSVSAKITPGEISAFVLNVNSPRATELVEFTYNPAYLPSSTAASFKYDFGDGTSSTDQNPLHTFSETGIYDVNIQITDEQGTVFSDTKQVFVWGEKWSYEIGAQIKQQIPTIADDGTIYIGSEDNSNFLAINTDGTLKWTYSGLGDNQGSSTSSVGSDGTIYIGSKDGNLHAIDSNGNLKWKFLLAGDPIWASPAISNDGTIYIGSDGDILYAINPNGTQKWTFNTLGSNIRSTPAIASNGTVYIASDDDNLYALNPSDGSVIWTFPIGGDVEGAVALDVDGTIILGVDQGSSAGAVYAINPDGTEKWVATTLGRLFSSPAIANNRVYVGTKDSNKLLAFNAFSGSQEWSFTAEDIILSSPTVDKNGAIYFGSFDDNVYVLNPDGTEKYKFNTTENVWSSAVIANDGTVYIGGYNGKLYAFEFFAESLAEDTWPIFGNNLKHTGKK
jgi:outer membrane protein assembly factor BamB